MCECASLIPGECGVCAPDAEAEWHQSPGPDQARRAPHSKGGLDRHRRWTEGTVRMQMSAATGHQGC